MDFGLGILTFGTLGFAAAFAYVSKRAAEKLKDDPSHVKSALSADGKAERLSQMAK